MKVLETNFTDSELNNIKRVLKNGDIGFGTNVYEFEKKFNDFSKKEFNISVNSASAAAFMIFAYLKEKYGICDVYTPSLAFTSPVWAAKHFGHNIIWIDIDKNLLFDINDYKEKRKIRCERYSDYGVKPVIMPILYGGVSNIEGFDSIHLDGYNEILIIDAAHCPHPTIKSDIIFTSFHPTKPICTSDGGMISTNIKEASNYFLSYRNFGRRNTNQSYNIDQNGFKFYMNNLNATIGLISLDNYHINLSIRKENFKILKERFKEKLIDHDEKSSYYFATLITNEADSINKKYNLARHYPMLHKTTFYNENDILINTETLHPQIVNLPLYKNFQI